MPIHVIMNIRASYDISTNIDGLNDDVCNNETIYLHLLIVDLCGVTISIIPCQI